MIDDGLVAGVVLADGRRLDCGAVVLTTGTFLRGLIHIGERKFPAGRMNEKASLGLSATFQRAGFKLGRLKTARRRGSTAGPSTGRRSKCRRRTKSRRSSR